MQSGFANFLNDTLACLTLDHWPNPPEEVPYYFRELTKEPVLKEADSKEYHASQLRQRQNALAKYKQYDENKKQFDKKTTALVSALNEFFTKDSICNFWATFNAHFDAEEKNNGKHDALQKLDDFFSPLHQQDAEGTTFDRLNSEEQAKILAYNEKLNYTGINALRKRAVDHFFSQPELYVEILKKTTFFRSTTNQFFEKLRLNNSLFNQQVQRTAALLGERIKGTYLEHILTEHKPAISMFDYLYKKIAPTTATQQAKFMLVYRQAFDKLWGQTSDCIKNTAIQLASSRLSSQANRPSKEENSALHDLIAALDAANTMEEILNTIVAVRDRHSAVQIPPKARNITKTQGLFDVAITFLDSKNVSKNSKNISNANIVNPASHFSAGSASPETQQGKLPTPDK